MRPEPLVIPKPTESFVARRRRELMDEVHRLRQEINVVAAKAAQFSRDHVILVGPYVHPCYKSDTITGREELERQFRAIEKERDAVTAEWNKALLELASLPKE